MPSRRRPLRVAPVRDRGGHLEQREVADDRAAQPAVQAAQRHQVDGRERLRGDDVEVGAVARVEPERVHRVGEQLRVDALGAAAAVLVGLDLDQRRLRRSAEAGDRPGVRVGLLELVRRAVDDELLDLLERRVALDVLRERATVVLRLRSPECDVEQLRRRRLADGADGGSECVLERCLERLAEGEQRRLPLPALVDAGEAAVVQLVAEVERELEVLVGERVEAVRGAGSAGAGAAARAARRAALSSCRRAGSAGRALLSSVGPLPSRAPAHANVNCSHRGRGGRPRARASTPGAAASSWVDRR